MLHKRNSINVRSRDNNQDVIDERLFIGTLGVNCLKYTRAMIDSVQTDCKTVRLSYIDNGSTDENCELLKKFNKNNQDIDEFNIKFNGRNAGVAFGWNQLIKEALDWNATKIIICNNDIQFGPDTINGLCKAYTSIRGSIEETVMVTATNQTRDPTQLVNHKRRWNNHEHPDFSCFMITPETIDRIGFFPEIYKPAFFEDNDAHWRIILQGYKAFGTDWAPYSHIASRTRFENPDIISHEQYRLNKIKFYQTMSTSSVDQSIAEKRYQQFIKDNPDKKHPCYSDVISWCKEKGHIDQSMLDWLDTVDIYDEGVA